MNVYVVVDTTKDHAEASCCLRSSVFLAFFFLCAALEWLSAQSGGETIALEKLPISLPLSCLAEHSAIGRSQV